MLKAQLAGRRLRLDDSERRRLAVLGHRLGHRRLADVATIVTLDTILRWHRELVARKWTYGGGRPRGLHARIRALVVRTRHFELLRQRPSRYVVGRELWYLLP